MTHNLVSTPASSRTLTALEFHQLAQVPPSAGWFATPTPAVPIAMTCGSSWG